MDPDTLFLLAHRFKHGWSLDWIVAHFELGDLEASELAAYLDDTYGSAQPARTCQVAV